MFTYNGYTAYVEIDPETEMLFGSIIDIQDVITFTAKTVDEIIQEFHRSVDDYLKFCQEQGKTPEKPFSGKLPYRTTPERHRQIFITAKQQNKSINAWMDEVLEKALEQSCKT